MVADLVRDDVRLCEVAGRAEALRQLVEEAQIEINLAVLRAVKRTGRRLRESAGRVDRVAEQHHRGPLLVGAPRRRDVRGRVVALAIPAAYDLLVLGSITKTDLALDELSLLTALVLLVAYVQGRSKSSPADVLTASSPALAKRDGEGLAR